MNEALNNYLSEKEVDSVIEIGLFVSKSYPFNPGEIIRFQRSNLWYKIVSKKPIPHRDGWYNVKLKRVYSVEEKVNYEM